MTHCRNIQKKLSAYQDGELVTQDRARIAMHLRGCPVCSRQFAELEQAWQGLERLFEIRPAPDFYDKLERKIEQETKPILLRNLRNVFQFLPSFAATFALLLIGILVGTYAGNILAGNRLWPLPKHENVYAQEVTLASFDAFEPVAPGTLAEGYMRVASYGREGN